MLREPTAAILLNPLSAATVHAATFFTAATWTNAHSEPFLPIRRCRSHLTSPTSLLRIGWMLKNAIESRLLKKVKTRGAARTRRAPTRRCPQMGHFRQPVRE